VIGNQGKIEEERGPTEGKEKQETEKGVTGVFPKHKLASGVRRCHNIREK